MNVHDPGGNPNLEFGIDEVVFQPTVLDDFEGFLDGLSEKNHEESIVEHYEFDI